MIRIYRVVGAASPINWEIGQFADEKHALAEYNAEVRSFRSDGTDDSRPELEFAERGREVEFFLTEEEVTHTQTRRDEAMETGRWGLVRTPAAGRSGTRTAGP
jgi:hypothetical protein